MEFSDLNLRACTQFINDPRNSKNQTYSLENLILIIFSAAISGYGIPRNMSKFAELKPDWLKV
ncbi:MAG: transposase family protein [Gammaproteobacteria bacterium]|nr:transposase family protein [Gammaproteobacteria bacterium]